MKLNTIRMVWKNTSEWFLGLKLKQQQMKEHGPLSLTVACCGLPTVWWCSICNLLRKACTSDKLLKSFQVQSFSDSRLLWNFCTRVWTRRFYGMHNLREMSTRRERKSANHFFRGQRGATRIIQEFQEISTLDKICLTRVNMEFLCKN